MTSSIIIAIVAAIVGSCTIIKNHRAAIEIPDGTTVTEYTGKRVSIFDMPAEMQSIVGLFDGISRTTCVKDYSMSIDDRYRKKNHFHTYSSRNLLMEAFTTCSLNDATDEIENEIQIFLTKDEYLCVFSIKDTASNRHILKTL